MTLNIARYREIDDTLVGVIPLTPVLCEQIARWNSYLSPEEVKAALARGDRVYTSFSYFERAKERAKPDPEASRV